MAAEAFVTVVDQLTAAGLSMALTPEGGLSVAPARNLTGDLRDLIRGNKAMLVDWLAAANDESSFEHGTDASLVGWEELARTYHAHHFACPACIAAGQGSSYGQRCATGAALWQAYCE